MQTRKKLAYGKALALLAACMSIATIGAQQDSSAASAATPKGSAQNGQVLFERYGCYQCHGRQAQGGLDTGPRIGPRPIAFAAFERYLRQPTGNMPPYTAAVVTATELADIYAFLQSVPEPRPVGDIPDLSN